MTRDPARLSRRRFLKVAGWTGLAAALTACGLGRVSPSALPSGTASPSASPSPSPTVTPSPSPTPSATPGRTLREQIGRMLLVGFRGTTAAEAATAIADVRDNALGGVVLFDYDTPTKTPVRNIVSPAQVTALVAALRDAASQPLIVAIDEEGGLVARLDPDHGFPATISAAALGARNQPAFTESYARGLATTLRDVGVDLNLAPVVDLNLNPSNPIIGALDRSFSANPDVVVAQAEAFIRGHRSSGVQTALKHFPGHGSATGDTHLGVVDVTGVWQQVELEPFRRIIADGLADAVLTAHIFDANLDPQHPASLSKPIVTGMLRGQLGWTGVVISDDLQMGAIRARYGYPEAVALAIEAGIDLLTIANQQIFEEGIVTRTIDIIEGFVSAGRISESRIADSAARIDAFLAARSG
jgi:beta-N-acetylhexosaminidase